jgi:hypothetical protein
MKTILVVYLLQIIVVWMEARRMLVLGQDKARLNLLLIQIRWLLMIPTIDMMSSPLLHPTIQIPDMTTTLVVYLLPTIIVWMKARRILMLGQGKAL